MWGTNLRVLGVVLGTLAVYTAIANSIPQVQSEVPRTLTLGADVTPEQLVAAGQAGVGRHRHMQHPFVRSVSLPRSLNHRPPPLIGRPAEAPSAFRPTGPPFQAGRPRSFS